MATGDDRYTGVPPDEQIVQEARDRLKRAREKTSQADTWAAEDDKFANADPRNGWQWPDRMFTARSNDDRPCLTLNTVRIHNDLVINEGMKNRSSIRVRPDGGKASYEAAQVLQSIIRRIEYISRASIAYNVCFTKQIDCGIGYVYLETDWAREDGGFDQELYIRPCLDPSGVVLDCDIRQPDGLDANWGFLLEPRPRDEFDRLHPEFKGKLGASTLGVDNVWLDKDTFLLATYYRRNAKNDEFVSFVNPENNNRIEKLKSDIVAAAGKDIYDALRAQIDSGKLDGRTRKVTTRKVEWFTIAGDQIVDRGPWIGKYVPIIRCVGRETLIAGKLDRKGLTRQLIDGQRMLNYNASGQVEYGALQPKTPYIGPARAFEGQEQWKDANKKNYAFLQYNDIDDEMAGDLAKIDRPQRDVPPQTAPVYMEGGQIAERWLMMCSGQFQAQMGQNDQQSAASGKAINERQRQSDTSTYHYTEHQGDFLRALGIQALDIIPKLLDVQRKMHVTNEDGSKRWIQIDPDQKEAVVKLKKEDDEAAEVSFNPRIGEYDCMSDPGPNYATQRQEAWNAISLILQQNMELAATIGDLLFKYGDFPGADEIMQRLRKEIENNKPYLFNEQANPGILQLQQQLQAQQQLNAEMQQKLAEMNLELIARKEKRDIEVYKAESDRLLKVATAQEKLTGLPGTREELMSLMHQTFSDMLSTHVTEVTKANAAEIGDPESATS